MKLRNATQCKAFLLEPWSWLLLWSSWFFKGNTEIANKFAANKLDYLVNEHRDATSMYLAAL